MQKKKPWVKKILFFFTDQVDSFKYLVGYNHGSKIYCVTL